MPHRALNGQSVENLVLLGIPENEFSILAPYLDHVGLDNGAVLERGVLGAPVHYEPATDGECCTSAMFLRRKMLKQAGERITPAR